MEQFYRYQGVFILVLYALMFTGALSGPLSITFKMPVLTEFCGLHNCRSI